MESRLTREQFDADGALLAQGIHRWVLGQAGVLSFIRCARLLQCQQRGWQDPVTILTGGNRQVSTRVWKQDVLLAKLFAALPELTNANKLRKMENR